jgi:hypothetical protein
MDNRILYESNPETDKQLVASLFEQVVAHTDGNEYRAVEIVSRVLGMMIAQVAKYGSVEDATTVSAVVLEQLEKTIRLARQTR